MYTDLKFTPLMLLLSLLMSGQAFAADRIWDNELRRYLKEDDFKYEEFMTEEEAVENHTSEIAADPQRAHSPYGRKERTDRATNWLEVSRRIVRGLYW